MTLPTPQALFDAIDATWPAAAMQTVGPWVIRNGLGGGKRVSAATCLDEAAALTQIAQAEAAMTDLGQTPLFMIRPEDTALDAALAARGYAVVDPVTLYACPIATFAREPDRLTAFTVWPPLAVQAEIWAAGGIGPARLNIMHRAKNPKISVLGRNAESPAGTAFVAIHDGIAMLHGLEIADAHRRKGLGINIMRSAALWAQNAGARYFSVLVTDANLPGNSLYLSLGMTAVTNYHYRVRKKE